MSEPAPTYRIERVTDFLAVPVDRLADCLGEFKVWLAMQIASDALLRDIKHEIDGGFVWVDDGKGECVHTIKSMDGEILHQGTVLVKSAAGG